MKYFVLKVLFLLANASAKLILHSRVEEDASGAVGAVLEATSQASCSLILLTDGVTSPYTILKLVSSERSSPRGVTVMEVTADSQDANVTLALLYHLVGQARQVRLGSWCVSVVVVSHDPAFLAAFAESSLKGRLLVWATRLLVVTRLTLPQLHALLPAHWTFSMMNTITFNLENGAANLRFRLYTHLPYSPDGAQVVKVAIWSPERGIVHLTSTPLFIDKFSNFYGATVNVTALPWPPFWDEVESKAPDGTVVEEYAGSDYLTLKTISETLTFTVNVVPTASWAEAVTRVEERVAFMTPVYHVAFPERWKQYDFTHLYEFNQASFCLSKPGLKPRWQSLYYPLASQVWAAVLVALLLMLTLFSVFIIGGDQSNTGGGGLSTGALLLEVSGILVGQNLQLRVPDISSIRLLFLVWMVSSFIIGTVYRSNLTAALTLPKYPPRPETLEQLVHAVDRVTMPPFGEDWRKFFAASESEVYQKLAKLMLIGPTTRDGLQMAQELHTAQMNGRRYMANMIAEHFTQADGSSQLYLGQESIFPGPSGWPVPHDAPYKHQLDRCLMAIIEAGLYEKWSENTLSQTRRESQRRQREFQSQQQQQQQQQERQGGMKGTEDGSSIMALNLTHMQGPLILLLLSLAFAGMALTGEIFVTRYKKPDGTHITATSLAE